MANKHGAGCTCCGEFDCGPCDPVINSINLTYSGQTIAIPISKQLSELGNCTLIKNICLGVDEIPLVDYFAAVEYDARANGRWKVDTKNVACCDPSSLGGGGGPGPGPVPADTCIPCATYRDPISVGSFCYDLYQPGIFADVLKNFSVKATLLLHKSLYITLQFEAATGGNVRVFGTIESKLNGNICYEYSFDWEAYYNDNCPRGGPDVESCTIAPLNCIPPLSNGLPNLVGRSFDCAVDTPNWVLMGEGSRCFRAYAFWLSQSLESCCTYLIACENGQNETRRCYSPGTAFNLPCGLQRWANTGWFLNPADNLFGLCTNTPTGNIDDYSACDCDGTDFTQDNIPFIRKVDIAYDFTVSCDDLCGAHASDSATSEGASQWTTDIESCMAYCGAEAEAESLGDPFSDPASGCYWPRNTCQDTSPQSVTIDMESYSLPTTGVDLEIDCAGGP